jgi:hypothetical protein
VAEEPAVAEESPEPAVQEEPQKEEPAQPAAANGGGGQQSQAQQSSGRTEGSVSSSGSSGRNPSWGRYEGGRNSEGLPHGNGVVRITRSTILNGESVGSGDRIEGLFRNGYLNFGTLYKANGEEVKLKDVNLF